VAVHGYAGFLGVVAAGIVLWGYPSSMNEGFDTPITPWGQLIGAIIMFFVLGFVPAYVVAWILKKVGMLRIPRAVELAGLDFAEYHGRYADEKAVAEAEAAEARASGLLR
jgi:ammonia channel protein AmtB